MRSSRRLVAVLAAAAVVAVVVPAYSGAAGRPFTTSLTGAAEVPGPGDPDGSGSASVALNQGMGEVCVEFTVEGVAPIIAAHIHVGPAGVAGPVVIPLPASGSGCVTADPELINDIRKNPENYCVNVHNQEFPAGALRGQLGK